MRRITAQSYNNKLQVISTFLQHIKEQSLIQKQPSKSEGCFCIYVRKA